MTTLVWVLCYGTDYMLVEIITRSRIMENLLSIKDTGYYKTSYLTNQEDVSLGAGGLGLKTQIAV